MECFIPITTKDIVSSYKVVCAYYEAPKYENSTAAGGCWTISSYLSQLTSIITINE